MDLLPTHSPLGVPLKESLSRLNNEQLEAVLHEGSPLLILAGAGSGKTRVITTKIAYMAEERGLDPGGILALTFTKKAANEMKERAIKLSPLARGSQISTFHSFGAQFLRRNPSPLIPLNSNFTIYDEADSLSLLIAAAGNSSDPFIKGLDKKQLKHFVHLISLCKDFGLTPSDIASGGAVATFDDDLTSALPLGDNFDLSQFCVIYNLYESALRKSGNADFGDLITLPKILLERDRGLLSRLHSRLLAILIDEYQDVNRAQVNLIKKIVAGSGIYLSVVGDDDQSIYGFRGSDVKNILNFRDVFPGTKIIKLIKNYRSTKSILDLANTVIACNSGRLGKDLTCARMDLVDKKPQLIKSLSDRDEAVTVCDIIKNSVAEGAHYSDFAILYRINAQSMTFEEIFIKNKIPYKIEGTLKFYEREEVKTAIAYLCLLANDRDSVAFSRVLNTPARHIGRASLDRILLAGDALGTACLDYNSILGMTALSKKTAGSYIAFCELFQNLHSALNNGVFGGLEKFLSHLLDKSGLITHYAALDAQEGSTRVANLAQLVNTALGYEASLPGLISYLDDMTLFATDPRDPAALDKDCVTLITVHNTKGLEYPCVLLTGLEDGLFPLYKNGTTDLEEERRLFYVAVTRARERLFLFYSTTRLFYGRVQNESPSQFLYEAASSLEGGVGYGSEPLFYDYKVGQRVYHDDYGEGVVTQFETRGREALVTIRFLTGRVMRFLPEYQKNKLSIIANDS